MGIGHLEPVSVWASPVSGAQEPLGAVPLHGAGLTTPAPSAAATPGEPSVRDLASAVLLLRTLFPYGFARSCPFSFEKVRYALPASLVPSQSPALGFCVVLSSPEISWFPCGCVSPPQECQPSEDPVRCGFAHLLPSTLGWYLPGGPVLPSYFCPLPFQDG